MTKDRCLLLAVADKASRSHSRDCLEHSPAPGAPGSTSPVKQFRSQRSAFSNTYTPAPNSFTTTAGQNTITQGSSYSSQQNTFHAAKPFQKAEEGYSTSSSVAVKKEMTVDYCSQALGSSMRNDAALQHPVFPDHPGNPSAVLSESQLPALNLCEPPPSFSNFSSTLPMTPSDGGGGVSGTLNISKTYNVTYQSSYAPSLYYPQAMYPYQQQSPSPYNPGLRQSMKYSYDCFNRPRSRNAMVRTGKDGLEMLEVGKKKMKLKG